MQMLPPTIVPQQRQGHTIAPCGSKELKMHVLPLDKFCSIPAAILNAFRVTFKVNFLKTVIFPNEFRLSVPLRVCVCVCVCVYTSVCLTVIYQ